MLALGYLIVPICIFFLTWLKLYFAIPATLILIWGFYHLSRSTHFNSKDILEIPIKHFVMLSVFLLLWIWTTNIGNFFVCVHDTPWRNATFRDLVLYDWPIIYPETDNALVYYFFYWLVPALLGKVFGWTVGNIALFLWTYLGIFLTFLILLHVCCAKTPFFIWVCAIFLFGWSGLNTVGTAITQIININAYPFALNNGMGWLDSLYNGYSFNFFYRSNQETLSQIFNQASPTWIIVLLTYENRKDVQNFAFLGLCLLPFAPLPFIGLLIFFISYFIRWL